MKIWSYKNHTSHQSMLYVKLLKTNQFFIKSIYFILTRLIMVLLSNNSKLNHKYKG
jgi:hypothetical protein